MSLKKLLSMDKIKRIYSRIDERIRDLSRTKYAVLIGLASGGGSMIASSALGGPDYFFSVTMGVTMTVLYYISDPNHSK